MAHSQNLSSLEAAITLARLLCLSQWGEVHAWSSMAMLCTRARRTHRSSRDPHIHFTSLTGTSQSTVPRTGCNRLKSFLSHHCTRTPKARKQTSGLVRAHTVKAILSFDADRQSSETRETFVSTQSKPI
uniref:Putative secreted protein n=1 Tax=Ixodes scapularis TaxID=6945 RepID=A0A4D5RYH9_IXOSC